MASKAKQKSAKKPVAKKASTKRAAKRAAPKKKTVQAIPAGYHAITPYLAIQGATQALEFYKRAFGALEKLRMDAPGGKIGHAEVKIGNSMVMLADEMTDGTFSSPSRLGGSSVLMHVYVPNVDKFVEKALAEGAKLVRPIADQFYGDRTAGLEDPFGHHWYVATHVEDLTPAEMKRRGDEAMKKKQQG